MFAMGAISSPEKREVSQEQIDAVFAVLEDWFQAIEDGKADHRLPDPAFVLPPGRPAITAELVAEFTRELDREMDTDAFGVQGRKFGADASCEFHRLADPQRVALVQQLMGVLLTEEEMGQRAEALRGRQAESGLPEVA